MFIDRHRPLAAIAAGLLTTVLFVWIDGALHVDRLQAALTTAQETHP